ncbi:MAG: toxin [Acidobacteria bacterium]|nr:toxin [Acidobacteriota bacterium]MSO61216.1 toxin [Acidobacteriota bacterium]
MKVEFIEAPLFTQLLPNFLKDDEYRDLQQHLSRDPEAGDVMPGTGGFRKLRWADTRRGKGKRSGLRLIYYFFLADAQIWLITLYDKDSMSDLSPAEKRVLKAAIERQTQQRAMRRTDRRRK